MSAMGEKKPKKTHNLRNIKELDKKL